MKDTPKPGTVRIIGGQWRGKKIAITGKQIRPTPDRVRETMFNWLMSILPGSRCLDLFAGTGVLGLEALSRGASWVTFVECDKHSAAAIAKQSEAMQIAHCRVISRDALQLLAGTPEKPFDIIFLDPPYASDLLEQCLPILAKMTLGWSHPETRMIIEYPKGKAIALPAGWTSLREQQAGEVSYALITYEPNQDDKPA